MTRMIGLLCLALGLAPAARAQAPPEAAPPDAATAFDQRVRLSVFDAACGVLSPSARTALETGRLQARGALLRAGRAADARAAALEAEPVDCDDPVLNAEANRAEAAAEAWLTARREDFPGQERTWSTNRNAAIDTVRWRVVQPIGARAFFGVIAENTDRGLALVVLAPSDAAVSAVRLRVRDPGLAAERVAPGLFGAANEQTDPLAQLAPPDAFTRIYWAEARFPLPASLAPGQDATAEGSGFRFSQSALRALAALDPREAASLELLDRRGRISETLYVEIGDFQAAQLFADAIDR
ncbi:MAG: hypothetical protein ACFB2Z_02795 [Maricaulaceae bacterium]